MQQGQGQPLAIFGAGGHGMVIADAALEAGFELVGFVDQARQAGDIIIPADGKLIHKPISVIDLEAIDRDEAALIVGIGDNTSRSRVQQRLLEQGYKLTNVIHPSATVSPRAKLSDGVYVGPRATVNIQAELAEGVIINTAALVEHHCQIGAFAHIAPGVVLTGGVNVGERALIGARAVIKPGLSIGDDARVGAGAVVLRDVADGETAVGVVR